MKVTYYIIILSSFFKRKHIQNVKWLILSSDARFGGHRIFWMLSLLHSDWPVGFHIHSDIALSTTCPPWYHFPCPMFIFSSYHLLWDYSFYNYSVVFCFFHTSGNEGRYFLSSGMREGISVPLRWQKLHEGRCFLALLTTLSSALRTMPNK